MYGNYGRSASSYTPSSRRPVSSSYTPFSYTRRSSGGPYGLSSSYSSSYVSPSSSPRSSIVSGSVRELRPSYSTYKADSRRDEYSPELTGYNKLATSKSTSSLGSDRSSYDEGQPERPRHRYGSSTSITDSELSKSDTSSHYGSKSALSDDDNKDFKKLYEETKKENERLRDSLRKTEEELDKTKKQMQKQGHATKNSTSEMEKKERRSLERKISEMEEELKQIEKLKADNERLKEENSALIRVISKISQ